MILSYTTTYMSFFFFFFNDTATTEIYTLSLHDALPICGRGGARPGPAPSNRRTAWVRRGLARGPGRTARSARGGPGRDRKSTRLNSSHANISYAVFCLKKKKTKKNTKNTIVYNKEKYEV